jgi:tRNA(Ile)-lysidine synthase
MRLVRGAGTRGLAGIRARHGQVVRPLLGVRRHALVSYLEARHLDWRDDESNRDVTIVRNRIRHDLVPFVEQRFSPAIVESLGRLAAIARDEDAFLEQAATAAAASVVLVEEGRARVDREGLRHLPRALGRRVLRRALEETAPGRAFSSRHVEAALELAETKAEGRTLRLPGVLAELSGKGLVLSPMVETRAGRRSRGK